MLPHVLCLFLVFVQCKDTVFITGASSGIGASSAKYLAESGFNVAVCARRIEKLSPLVQEIQKNGGKAFAVRCDVSNPESLKSAFSMAEVIFGGIDYVLANAGYDGTSGQSLEYKDDFQKVLDINVKGSLATHIEALRAFAKNPNRDHAIVFVSSIAGTPKRAHGEAFSDFSPFPNVYCMSKAAIDAHVRLSAGQQLTKAKEGNVPPVRILGISPGVFRSEMTERITDGPLDKMGITSMEQLTVLNPLFPGRVGDPIEIGRALQAIFTGKSGWKTGDVVVIDNDATYHSHQHYRDVALGDIPVFTVDRSQVFDVTGNKLYQFEKSEL